MVSRQGILHFLCDNMVQMDLPAPAHRPAAGSGMEISAPHQLIQPRADGTRHHIRMVSLTHH